MYIYLSLCTLSIYRRSTLIIPPRRRRLEEVAASNGTARWRAAGECVEAEATATTSASSATRVIICVCVRVHYVHVFIYDEPAAPRESSPGCLCVRVCMCVIYTDVFVCIHVRMFIYTDRDKSDLDLPSARANNPPLPHVPRKLQRRLAAVLAYTHANRPAHKHA